MRTAINYPVTAFNSGEIDVLDVTVKGGAMNKRVGGPLPYVRVQSERNRHGRSISLSMTPEEAILLGRDLIAQANRASIKAKRLKVAA